MRTTPQIVLAALRSMPPRLTAAWRRCWRSGLVLDPVLFTGSERLKNHQTTQSLQWQKLKVGPLVMVFAGFKASLHRLDIVPCADVALSLFQAPADRPYRRRCPTIVGAGQAFDDAVPGLLAESVKAPAAGTAVLRDVTIAATGAVISKTGHVVAESLINTEGWSAFGAFVRCHPASALQMRIRPISVQRRFSGPPYVLLKQTFDANYGHWLIDCLPRLQSVADHYDLTQCKFIVSAHHGAMQKVYIDSLAAFGIAQEQIVTIDYRPTHIDWLIYPTPLTRHPWVKSRTIVPFLESIPARLCIKAMGGPKRLYVSRNFWPRRRLVNESEIIDHVQGFGFEVVHPEMMTFDEQISAFQDAEIVVGSYGAALSNVVFSPRGATLFALTTQFMEDDFFWDLMDHKGGRYMSLHGPAAGSSQNLDSDFVIDVPLFKAMLRECMEGREHTEHRDV